MYISGYANAKFGLGDVGGVTKVLTQACHLAQVQPIFKNGNIVLLGGAGFPPYRFDPWIGTGQ
jgi:hypothetical protein